jgi:hypothetical protein
MTKTEANDQLSAALETIQSRVDSGDPVAQARNALFRDADTRFLLYVLFDQPIVSFVGDARRFCGA